MSSLRSGWRAARCWWGTLGFTLTLLSPGDSWMWLTEAGPPLKVKVSFVHRDRAPHKLTDTQHCPGLLPPGRLTRCPSPAPVYSRHTVGPGRLSEHLCSRPGWGAAGSRGCRHTCSLPGGSRRFQGHRGWRLQQHTCQCLWETGQSGGHSQVRRGRGQWSWRGWGGVRPQKTNEVHHSLAKPSPVHAQQGLL